MFLNFNSIWGPHFDTDLEMMLDLIKNDNDVFSLSCGNCFNSCCLSNPNQDKKYCKRCQKTLRQGLNLIKLPINNQLKIQKRYELENLNFNSIEDIKSFSVDNINIGFGVVSSIVFLSRDYKCDIKEYENTIINYINNSYTVLKTFIDIQKTYKFDAIYMFNGRFSEYYSVVDFCIKNNIEFYLHERGSDLNKYNFIKNNLFHTYVPAVEEINNFWTKETDEKLKIKSARNWFEQRRQGIVTNWKSFTDYQIKGKLPNNFNSTKNNFVFFNSSFDEYVIFDEWQSPIEKNENVLLENILKHYINDDSKHFYFRIHPNLKNVNTSQMSEIKKLDKKNYKNLTIIYPDENIDTYQLMDSCDKTIVSGSTTGLEATYWGKPSIVVGKALYAPFGCSYIPQNYEELFGMIDDNLPPKLQDTTYKYGYWVANYGYSFKYYKPTDLFHGKFLGVDLRKKPLHVKIRLAIQNYFKNFKK